MDLAPAARRRFFAIYASLRPKNPAVAWFLAVGLGPFGANLYREKWAATLGALVSLNGLGAWWIESWFTTPYLVLIDNRATIAYAMRLLEHELQGTSADGTSTVATRVALATDEASRTTTSLDAALAGVR